MRPALCEDALRLGRILAELVPQRARGARPRRADGDPGVARCARASDPSGEPILLLDQDRARWDQLLIRRGLDCARARRARSRRRAGPVRAAGRDRRLPRARARRPRRRTGPRIAALYDALAAARAVAGRRAESRGRGGDGVRSGGRARDRRRACATSRALRGYHLLPSVRGDLLAQARPARRGAAEFERAAALTRNERERELLLARARACRAG